MKYLKLFLAILFLLFGNRIIAQGDLFIDQYIFHQQIFNPAAIGQNSDFEVFLYGDRNFNNTTNPQYKYLISGYKSFKNNDLGIGLSFIQNKFLKEKSTFLLGDVTYEFKIDSLSVLKFGVKSGVLNYNNPLTQYQLYPDGQYDLAFANDINDYYLLIGLGVYYSSKRLRAGISSPQIVKTKINNKRTILNKNLFVFTEYKIDLNEKIVFLPHFLFNYNESLPNSYIASITFQYYNKVAIGGSFNFRNSLIAYSRWVFNNGIGIGYSYNFVTNNPELWSFNKHGVSISYEL